MPSKIVYLKSIMFTFSSGTIEGALKKLFWKFVFHFK